MDAMEVTGKIPVPPISEFLIEEFMRPMGLTVDELSKGADISLSEAHALLQDEIDVTPELSKKLGIFFGVSDKLFYRLQQDIKRRLEIYNFEASGQVVVAI